jgi:hypothetical protein
VCHANKDGLWSPEAVRLIGSETSWWEPGRWLRGTQIQHWLRMVTEDLPELGPAMAKLL